MEITDFLKYTNKNGVYSVFRAMICIISYILKLIKVKLQQKKS